MSWLDSVSIVGRNINYCNKNGLFTRHRLEKAYLAARDVHLPRLKETFREYFTINGLAAIMLPATRIPAVPIGSTDTVEIGGKKVPFSAAISRNVAPGSTAGLPGLVLPARLTGDGLPVSLELDRSVGTDRTLLALGLSLERVLGRLPAPRPPAG